MGLLALAVAAAVVGCSSDESSSDAVEAGEISALLAELPEPDRPPDAFVFVLAGNLAEASRLAAIEVPAAEDAAAVDAWLAALDAGPVTNPLRFPTVPFSLDDGADAQEWQDEIGWSPLEATWFASAQYIPDTSTVYRTEVDEERLTASLGPAVDGIHRIGGDEDHVRIDNQRTAARRVAEPLRFAQREGWLLVSTTTSLATTWVEREHRPLSTALPALGSIAARFDTAGVQAAQMLAPIEGRASEGIDGIGIGVGVADDATPIGVVVYHVTPDGDVDAVVADVERLLEGISEVDRRLWRDVFATAEVTAVDDTVVLRVTFIDADEARHFPMWILGGERLLGYRVID